VLPVDGGNQMRDVVRPLTACKIYFTLVIVSLLLCVYSLHVWMEGRTLNVAALVALSPTELHHDVRSNQLIYEYYYKFVSVTYIMQFFAPRQQRSLQEIPSIHFLPKS
jgi:hypothetical protein